jgi:ribonuclease HI
VTVDTDIEPLTPDTWIPRQQTLTIRVDVPGVENKAQNPVQLKFCTSDMISQRYPPHSWIQAYNDGSAEKAVKNAGSGVYITYPAGPPFASAIPVGEQSSNYRAEVQALQSAAHHLIEQVVQERNIVFLTDSLSALQSLSAGPSDATTRQLLAHICHLSDHNNVVLQWIPAHVGIAGNEAADKLAKEGSKKEQPQPPISYHDAKTLLKNKFTTEWNDKNDGYQPQKDSINKLNRHSQTIIFRLRTGHCHLQKHMKRLGLADTASCQCGAEEQTPTYYRAAPTWKRPAKHIGQQKQPFNPNCGAFQIIYDKQCSSSLHNNCK